MAGPRRTGRLYSKTHKILVAYERAAGCSVSVVDQHSKSTDTTTYEQKLPFCSLCKKYRQELKGKDGEHPCIAMHQKGIEESCRLGGSYIYMCELGFVFWTSPLYTGSRYAGALIAGNSLGIKKEEAFARIKQCYGDKLSAEQIRNHLAQIPERNYEETKALVQMMLICARQISGAGTEQDYGKTGKRSSEKTVQSGVNQGEIAANSAGRQSWAAQEQYVKNTGVFSPYPETPPNRAPGTQPHGTVSPYPVEAGQNKNSSQAVPSAIDEAPGIMEAERRLLAALRRGDSIAASKTLDNILNIFSDMSPGDFEFFQFRAIELVVFLSRAAVSGTNPVDDAALEANNRYLKKIVESTGTEELKERLHMIVDLMAGKIFSFQGIRHASALRKAEGFIRENFTRKLSLEEIAGVSGLSAPYFSTIFREEMGENLSAYLNRLRVEKAAGLLTESKATLNEIAEACGFEDQSWFSKIFKNYMGVSPGRYREQGGTNPEQYTG
jgi:AraC-like DNA-binding protein/ligand-binding sensor protein